METKLANEYVTPSIQLCLTEFVISPREFANSARKKKKKICTNLKLQYKFIDGSGKLNKGKGGG